jgi:hypothetical protein
VARAARGDQAHFFSRAAKQQKQAGITSVSTEKRADLATSLRRPGDVKIGSTRHGWKAAAGKTMLIDFTTVSSVCATWVALSAAAAGGGGNKAAHDKTKDVLDAGELADDQHFLALGFESEGYVPEEAKKLLHAWAKLHKEANDLTNGDMSLVLFKWTTELAFIRAKILAKCILLSVWPSPLRSKTTSTASLWRLGLHCPTSCMYSLRTYLRSGCGLLSVTG